MQISGISEGVAYLHRMNVVHGDLRALNVLIDDEEQPCLADFGLSRMLNELATQALSRHHQGGRWTAPELLDPESMCSGPPSDSSSNPTPKGDVFAFACVCYEIYTGKVPFHEMRREASIINAIVHGRRPVRPGLSDCHSTCPSDSMWGLITDCWRQKPEERPRMAEVCHRLHDINA
ncbi:kinase-like protein [Punctularia strigosozonata HHB-11173 SS5]|uniref:Kinase-like protein n=1 Tax=Punctularia strigosozonata (strain HHB-11173) TaxID=741275 RepID=R7S490_PUNST|nr:kinase-like protein [Punctularia strigosozonata HHB-11173 SS5]EIN04612.1 kinase-like protein [Punctularia strigosozonata HHB-11173 SS5]